jgi:hypothetical protein
MRNTVLRLSSPGKLHRSAVQPSGKWLRTGVASAWVVYIAARGSDRRGALRTAVSQCRTWVIHDCISELTELMKAEFKVIFTKSTMANAPSTFLDILEDYEDFKLVVYKSDSANIRCPIQRKAIGTSKLVITSGSFAHCLTTNENLKTRALWTNESGSAGFLASVRQAI